MDKFDVVVIGAGPSGVGAAIGAAKCGSKVLLIERSKLLGGMASVGLVNIFCNAHFDGDRFIIGGVFGELRQKLIERNSIFTPKDMNLGEPFDHATYHEIISDTCNRLNIKIKFNTKVISVDFIGNNSVNIILSDKSRIQANFLVDATGNADIIAKSGIPFNMGRLNDHAVMPINYCFIVGPIDLDQAFNENSDTITVDQNSGEKYYFVKNQPWVTEKIHEAQRAGEWTIPRDNGAIFSIPGRKKYVSVNMTRSFIQDPTDPIQLLEAEKEGIEQVDQCVRFFRKYLPGFQNATLTEVATQIGIRESRQLKGLYRLTKHDVMNYRQFDDVIAQCCYGIDDHVPNSATWSMDYFNSGSHYDIPWRCLVPFAGPPNLIVAGRSISSDREAMASFRVQPSAMAIGEAAGVTASICSTESISVYQVEVHQVQERLRNFGAILE